MQRATRMGAATPRRGVGRLVAADMDADNVTTHTMECPLCQGQGRFLTPTAPGEYVMVGCGMCLSTGIRITHTTEKGPHQ